MRPVNKNPGKGISTSNNARFGQRLNHNNLPHDKQKKGTNKEYPSNPYAYFGWTMMLPDRPRPLLRILDSLEKGCLAVGGFFVGVFEHASLIFNLIRYPESMGYIFGLTFPRPEQEKENDKAGLRNQDPKP